MALSRASSQRANKMNGFFITGTDTDVGKTIASTWALLHLNGIYWKPVQAGLSDGMSDTDIVKNLSGFKPNRFIKSTHDLTSPLSPHEAARIDGVEISLDDFDRPQTDHPLIIEGAGGVLVPLNDKDKMIDLMARLELPIILVARSSLGTINHTLLSLQALRAANLPMAGVIMNGPPNSANQNAIEEFGNVQVLAHLPLFPQLDKQALLASPPLVPLEDWTTPA